VAGDAPLELLRSFQEHLVLELRNDVRLLLANRTRSGYDFDRQREFQLLIPHRPEAVGPESESTCPETRFSLHSQARDRTHRSTDGDIDLPLVRVAQNESELVVERVDVAWHHLPHDRVSAHSIFHDLNRSRLAIIANVRNYGETVLVSGLRAVKHHASTARLALLIVRRANRHVKYAWRDRLKIDKRILATAFVIVSAAAGESH
jgi:hypothetical protein